MKTGVIIAGIISVIIAVVIGLVAYSYTQIQVSLNDVSFAGIDWAQASLSTLLKLGLNVLTGNWLDAALSLVQGIKLNLIFGLTNHGFFPVYIPDLSYDLSINGVNVGQGTNKVDAIINPGETKSFPFLQEVLIDSLKPAVSSIIASDGMLNLQVSGTAYFKLLGLTIPIPFESTKQISIVDEIKKHFAETSNQQSNYYPQLTHSYISLQASSYRISEGQTVTFSGRLTDSNGNGIPNQLVYVKRDISLAPDSTLGTGYTDANGYFSIDWIATKPITSNTANVYATFDGSSDYSGISGSDMSIQVEAYQTTQPSTNQNPSSVNQQTNQQLQSVIANSVYKVNPRTYTYISFYSSCSSTVTGSFSAEAALGNNIIVYILDQDNFNAYNNGKSSQTYYNSGKVATGSFNIELSPGTYYIVMSNTYSSFSTKTVTLQASYTCS